MQAPAISLITGVAFDKDSQIWISSPQGMFHEKAAGGWEYVPTNDLPKGKITAFDYDQHTGQLTAVVEGSNDVFGSLDAFSLRKLSRCRSDFAVEGVDVDRAVTDTPNVLATFDAHVRLSYQSAFLLIYVEPLN